MSFANLTAIASCFASMGASLGDLEVTDAGPDAVTIERHGPGYTRSVTLNARPVASGGPICLSASGGEQGITHDWDDARAWMEAHLR